jgi:OOP family OmpA-OmpF porin
MLLALFGARAATADNDVFDNRFYVAPMASLAKPPESRESQLGFGGGVGIGKSIIPHLGVEIVGDYLHYRGKSVSAPDNSPLCALLNVCNDAATTAPSKQIYGAGLGANIYPSPSNFGPFLHGDVEGGDRLTYNGGVGADVPIIGHGIALRMEALYHKEADFKAEPLFHVGIRVALGPEPAPAVMPETPVVVVPVAEPPPPPPPSLPPPAPPPCEMPASAQPISLEGCKTGDTIVLLGVNFDFNKALLTLNAKALLDQVASALTTRADMKVEVDGHTDGKGGAAYNLKLSEKRAVSVKDYLASKGIDPARMGTKGYGKTMPIADNKTDAGRELNRRVELKVVDSAPPATPAGVSAQAEDAAPPQAPSPDAAPPADAPAPAPQ